jgi:hypothetical protein
MGAYETAVLRHGLLADEIAGAGWSDAYAVARAPGTPGDPADWLRAIARRPPLWVLPALGARQVLALLCGIRPARGRRRVAPGELARAVDTGAFDCSVSLRCEPDRVVVTTVGTAHDVRGRFFLATAGRVHPYVVRAVLARAAAVQARARPDGDQRAPD